MKNKNVNKIVSAVVLIVLLCATVAGAYLGVFGRNTQYVTVREDGVDVERALYRQVAYIPNTINENWQEAVRPSAALAGGFGYTLTADGADNATLKKAAAILKARAELVTGSAAASVQDGSIVLTVAEDEYNSLIATVVSSVGEYYFAVYNSSTGEIGEPVLTKEHVQQAYYSASGSTYQVQVQFNSKGLSAIRSLVAENPGTYLYLMLDGQALGYVYFSVPSDGTLSFSASDWTSAFLGTACIRSGALPTAVTLADANVSAASMGGFLNGLIIGVAIALLLVCVYLIVRCGVSGLHGVWTLAAYIVLFFLLTALVAVAANWTMNLLGLIVIVLCVCAFVYGLVSIFNQTAASIRSGRSALPSYTAAAKKSLRCLAIVYGALLAIGLILMFAFQSGVYGVLGRIMSLSAIISFVLLFLFPRITLSCTAALGSKK